MKKIAMLGDLHGNLTATLAMEKALKDYHVDEIWFLGDAVGKGPQSRETCDWVRANCTRFVGGNAPALQRQAHLREHRVAQLLANGFQHGVCLPGQLTSCGLHLAVHQGLLGKAHGTDRAIAAHNLDRCQPLVQHHAVGLRPFLLGC